MKTTYRIYHQDPQGRERTLARMTVSAPSHKHAAMHIILILERRFTPEGKYLIMAGGQVIARGVSTPDSVEWQC